MKAILAIGLALGFASCCPAGDLKIATVDLQRVLADYYKAQEAGRFLQEKQTSFLKELEGLRLEGRRLMKEVHELQGRAVDGALSAAAREETKKNFELKVTDLRAFEVRYDDFKAQREAELQLHLTQTNKRILEDVMSVTRFIGEKESFHLILNANKANPAAGDVLFSKHVDDLTERVVASLNAAKPKANDAPPAATDGKPK